MWVAAVDFQKAFESIRHDAIWRSLRNHSIREQYICLLKKLYAGQHGTVLTDVESEEFEGRGIKVGGEKKDYISNLRLADDVLLTANSEPTQKYNSARTSNSPRQNEDSYQPNNEQKEINRD